MSVREGIEPPAQKIYGLAEYGAQPLHNALYAGDVVALGDYEAAQALPRLLCWGGLLAIIAMLARSIFDRDKKALFILIGYLSQLGPWLLITRLTFEYHYFPSVVFLTLAVCHMFNTFRRKTRHWAAYACSFTAVCLVLFCMFYPVLSGEPVSMNYTASVLKWLSTWPF